MDKVDWRRKTLRSFSSNGRTMVLSGSSPRRVQGRGAPPGACDRSNPHQDFTMWCCDDKEVTTQKKPGRLMWHRLSLMPGDAVRCQREEGSSFYSPASWVKLIFLVPLSPRRLLLPQAPKCSELQRFPSAVKHPTLQQRTLLLFLLCLSPPWLRSVLC